MEDLLKSKAFTQQTRWLEKNGDEVWCDITDHYRLYEPVDGEKVPKLWMSGSPRYRKVYAQLVLKNVAVEHALADTGTPQVIRQGNSWVLCNPEAEAKDWRIHRDYALQFAKETSNDL